MRLIAAALFFVLALPTAAQPADTPGTWAQTAKGVRIVGGSGSLTRFGDNTSVFLSPRVGRFVADNLALSTSVSLGYTQTVTPADGSFSSTRFGLGPTLTYYVGGAANGAVRPFVEGDLSVTATRTDSDLFEALGVQPETDWSIGGGLGAGVELPIARNVALRGEAFYNVSDLTFDDEVSFYGVSVGFSTFIY